MDPLNPSPFVVFTVIAAPAVLTNAAAVMSLTTTNRLARTIDRSRSVLNELAASPQIAEPLRSSKVQQVEILRERAMLLIRALGCYQLAIGSFAAATLVALVGTVLHYLEPHYLGKIGLVLSLTCAVVGVTAIGVGAWRVVRETRLSYDLLRKDTIEVMESLRSPILSSDSSTLDDRPGTQQ